MNEQEQVVLNSGEIVCPNCGVIGSEQHLFCAGCGAPMKPTNVSETINTGTGNTNSINCGTVYVTSSNTQVVQQPTVDKGYIPWVIAAYLGGPCGFILCFLNGLFLILGGLVSLVSAIYAKTKYPNVPIVKFTFWFIILVYVLSIIAFLFLIFLFVSACVSCANGIS